MNMRVGVGEAVNQELFVLVILSSWLWPVEIRGQNQIALLYSFWSLLPLRGHPGCHHTRLGSGHWLDLMLSFAVVHLPQAQSAPKTRSCANRTASASEM